MHNRAGYGFAHDRSGRAAVSAQFADSSSSRCSPGAGSTRVDLSGFGEQFAGATRRRPEKCHAERHRPDSRRQTRVAADARA